MKYQIHNIRYLRFTNKNFLKVTLISEDYF